MLPLLCQGPAVAAASGESERGIRSPRPLQLPYSKRKIHSLYLPAWYRTPKRTTGKQSLEANPVAIVQTPRVVGGRWLGQDFHPQNFKMPRMSELKLLSDTRRVPEQYLWFGVILCSTELFSPKCTPWLAPLQVSEGKWTYQAEIKGSIFINSLMLPLWEASQASLLGSVPQHSTGWGPWVCFFRVEKKPPNNQEISSLGK